MDILTERSPNPGDAGGKKWIANFTRPWQSYAENAETKILGNSTWKRLEKFQWQYASIASSALKTYLRTCSVTGKRLPQCDDAPINILNKDAAKTAA